MPQRSTRPGGCSSSGCKRWDYRWRRGPEAGRSGTGPDVGCPRHDFVDASCIGASTPDVLHWQHIVPWQIEAEGRQCRQMGQVDKRGFPRSKPKERSQVRGFRTGDLVRASCPAPLKTVGVHVGRVLVRASGSFDVVTASRRVEGISWRRCQRLQQGDGYTGHQERRALPPQGGGPGPACSNK